MGTTNFDRIQLGERSIEAAEISSESATAGHVLTADGSGGASWEAPSGSTPADRFHVILSLDYEDDGIGSFAHQYLADSTITPALTVTRSGAGFYYITAAGDADLTVFQTTKRPNYVFYETYNSQLTSYVLTWGEGADNRLDIDFAAAGTPTEWNGVIELNLVAPAA